MPRYVADFLTHSTQTLVEVPPERLSLTRKSALLLMFCFAEFLDAFSGAALFCAIPALETSMGITQSQSVWIMSAFQLTFASFLLISGRISDLYNSKIVFVTGLSFLGAISLCAGFVNNQIAMIVLRALMGIASAMTIPSALTLLVRVFPEPLEQARAIGVFGGCGASADVLGFFVGAVLVQYISYRWVFWFSAIITLSVSIGCLFLIPAELGRSRDALATRGARWKHLDLVGISILTVALILFIYAVTSGSVDGWAAPGVLTPLLISIVLAVGFFYWEALLPVEKAAIPPRTWFYENFSVLFGSALFPFLWWNATFLAFTTLWQDDFHWTVISTAVHMLPLGVAAFAMSFTGPLSRVLDPKWIISAGFCLTALSMALIAVGGGQPEDYWPYVFPAFALGSAGAMLTYTHTNIAIFQATPASMAGTVGAIFNGALQCGSAVGLAAFNSIETSVSEGGRDGRAAAFWFLLGLSLVELMCMVCFYKSGANDHASQPEADGDSGDAVKEKDLSRGAA